MRPLMLCDIARWCEARLLGDPTDSGDDVAASTIDAVAIDTRKLDPADGRRVLFVALRGENHDAHDHLDAAIAGGAAALLVNHATEASLPQLLCGDTEQALGDLAGSMQQGRPAKVLALTGSNGKTSVKTLLLGILERAGKAYANPGNRNNEIGLPLAVLEAPEDAQFAIYEMGAGKHGDIAYLTSIARPDVALVNNIMPAHLERMGTLLGVAQTKGAIYEALAADGTAVINADDAFAPYFEKLAAGRRVLRYGLEASADIAARGIALNGDSSRFELVTPIGNAAIALPLPGRHNVMNAMAAAAMAIGAGADMDAIREGLCHARPVPGRQVAHALGNGTVLIDDSYNANPGSVEAAIAALAVAGGEAWLVLGDMAELGEGSELLHAQVGDSARAKKIARLYATGANSRAAARAFGPEARHFADQALLIEALRHDLRGGVRVLVKGSRSSAMDKVVAALLADHGHARGGAHAA